MNLEFFFYSYSGILLKKSFSRISFESSQKLLKKALKIFKSKIRNLIKFLTFKFCLFQLRKVKLFFNKIRSPKAPLHQSFPQILFYFIFLIFVCKFYFHISLFNTQTIRGLKVLNDFYSFMVTIFFQKNFLNSLGHFYSFITIT